jgi:hypothetical protein
MPMTNKNNDEVEMDVKVVDGYNDLFDYPILETTKECPACNSKEGLHIVAYPFGSFHEPENNNEKGLCMECGFRYSTTLVPLELPELNRSRQQLGLEPLDSETFAKNHPTLEPDKPLFTLFSVAADFLSKFKKAQEKHREEKKEKVRKWVTNDRSILQSMEEEKEIEEGFIREEMRMSEK